MPNCTNALIASHAADAAHLQLIAAAVGERREVRRRSGPGVTPSASTIRPWPPDTARMLSSKSSSSSRSPTSSARASMRARRIGLVEVGVLRNRAPRARPGRSRRRCRSGPMGWQAAQAPQPLFDIRPAIGAPARRRRIELADRRVVELLADVDLVRQRARRRQRRRAHRRRSPARRAPVRSITVTSRET